MQKNSKIFLSLVLTLSLLASFFPIAANAEGTDDIALLRTRILNEGISGSIAASTADWFSSQNADGSWSDITYTSVGKAVTHISRLRYMARAYRNETHALYQNADVKEKIEKGLTYWFLLGLEDSNWWNEDIGQELELWELLKVSYDWLDDDLVSRIVSSFKDYTDDGISEQWKTACNLFWYAQQTVWRGIINENDADIEKGLERISEEIDFAAKEGIQTDYSFHQHGNQLYSTGYGMSFVTGITGWINLLQGTKYQFSQEKITMIADLVIEGTSYMCRDGYMDFSAAGRTICRKGEGQISLAYPISILARACPSRSAALIALNAEIGGSMHTGNKYFGKSDYLVHHRKGYYTSVSGSSDEVVGTEIHRYENSHGENLAYGVNCLWLSGDDYDGIYPFWDWGKIPGVTAPDTVPRDTQSGGQNISSKGSVYGLSDGDVGFMLMNFSDGETSAEKAWFMLDDEIVAMGNGVSSEANEKILTTVDQRYKNGAVWVGNAETDGGTYTKGEKIHHSKIGYIFPDKGDVTVETKTVTASWNDLDSYNSDTAKRSADTFTLYINHGTNPTDGKYQYITVPNISKSEFENYTAKTSVIENSKALLAVYGKDDGIGMAIMREAGEVRFSSDLTVSTDEKCLLMVREENGGYALSVSKLEDGNGTNGVTATINNTLTKHIQANVLASGETYTTYVSKTQTAEAEVFDLKIEGRDDTPKTNSVLYPVYKYSGDVIEKSRIVWECADSADAPDDEWKAIVGVKYDGSQATPSGKISSYEYEKSYDNITAAKSKCAYLVLSEKELGKFIRFKVVTNGGNSFVSQPTKRVEYTPNWVSDNFDEYSRATAHETIGASKIAVDMSNTVSGAKNTILDTEVRPRFETSYKISFDVTSNSTESLKFAMYSSGLDRHNTAKYEKTVLLSASEKESVEFTWTLNKKATIYGDAMLVAIGNGGTSTLLIENFKMYPSDYAAFDNALTCGEKLRGEVHFENKTDNPLRLAAIIATYDGGKLFDTEVRYFDLAAKEALFETLSTMCPETQDYIEAKIFLWNGDNLEPVISGAAEGL